MVGVDRSTHAVDALRFAIEEARVRGVEWQRPCRSGDVGPDAAESLDEPAHRRAVQLLDLLVVGAKGDGGFRHLLTGSVATQLGNHAPCPVVVVPTHPEPPPPSH